MATKTKSITKHLGVIKAEIDPSLKHNPDIVLAPKKLKEVNELLKNVDISKLR